MIHYLALGRTVLTNTPYFHAVDDLIHMSPPPRPVSGRADSQVVPLAARMTSLSQSYAAVITTRGPPSDVRKYFYLRTATAESI
jgi:hypothetical protein